MTAQADQRLQELELVERDISTAIQSAGQAITELAKEKPVLKQVESHTNHFLKTLESVENKLSKNITYLTQVSTSQPHEGSSYASQKNLQMAYHRLEHIRSRLNELERIKAEHIRSRQQVAARVQMQPTSTDPGLQRSFSQPDPMHSLQRSYSMTDQQTGLQRSFSQEQH